jgi:peptidoglycan/LPS O-acetylase OafA/YrhL
MVESPALALARVTAIDGLRGLLAVVVVAWHVCVPFGINWMLIPANIAVGLFFVLSGCVLTRGWEGRFALFIVRRFLRLWPVYALCLAAGYIVAGVPPVWSEFF